MSEPQAARPTQHVSEKALEDLDHNVIEPPPVPRRDIPEGAGKVVFVGAGPGAPDLVSVRGARVIETADIIIWASSLVHPDMVARHKEGAELIDSASIPLEDLEPLYTRARDEGLMVARVHTGDPSIYGATAEQRDLCRRIGIDFETIPGISAFSAAAARMDVEITVNDKADPAVDAAVAFEKLVSTEVDKDGNETTGSTDENVIATHEDINDEKQTVNTKWAPSIKTNADFDNAKQVKAGVTVKDTVTYTDLVPGKEYTLKAELINKKDGKSVLGTGEKTFTPEKSHGMVPVTITVNDDVKEPVQAAVAFEELTSTEVNDKGEETPGTTPEKPNHIAEHKDIDDDDQTVISHEVEDQDNPDDDTSNGGSSNGSSKDNKWWLILIPGIGLGKIIKDHFDHKDHGNHNGGHGDNTSSHNGGHGDNTGNHNGGNGHEVKGQDAPKGGNSDNGNGRGVEVQGQEPEETGNALPSNAERVEIKSVPSGATELEPGMQDYIK